MSAPLRDLAARDRALDQTYRPRLFRAADAGEATALDDLVRSGEPAIYHDTLDAQLAELVETRAAERKLSAAEIREHSLAHVRDADAEPSTYGTFVYYPWSRRLVRVLPAAEYEELRTSRNRNKITRDEQTRLGRVRVGVAGLSVGQSTAVTLVLEGVGGAFRLADFDTLSLSNMNRLRAGTHEIGVNKAYLVAREIYEINPYAVVEVFDRGIVDDTIDAFFSTTEPLDLLFEECDDLSMKVRLRHEARRRGVPVLMETSDRGLFDVERFDRESQRPLFHGLGGDLDPAKLAGMTTYEKVPIVLDIIGAKTMSRRMAASLLDIDATLKTWPQLASAVALGGAINTDAARRVVLGSFTGSGRYFVDLETIISDEAESAAREPAKPGAAGAPFVPSERPPSESEPREHPQDLRGPLSFDRLEQLVRVAALAPSGGNCQPWRFAYSRGVLSFLHDEVRSKSFLDFEHRATYAAFGAAAENLSLGAAQLGVGVTLEPFPDPSNPLMVCRAAFRASAAQPSAEDAALGRQVEQRVTNRKLGPRVALDAGELRALEETAERAGASLRILTGDADLEGLGAIVGMGERLRLMSPVMHREMMSELRWSRKEAIARADGLDLATLELTPTDEAGIRLIADESVMTAVRDVGGGHGLAQSSRKAIAAASAVGLLTMFPVPGAAASRVARTYFDGGRALQRVWLCATKLGLAMQPMTALLYLFVRLEQGNGAGLEEREKRELAVLRAGFRDKFPAALTAGAQEVMLFRIARTGAPSARSLRRPVSDILDIET